MRVWYVDDDEDDLFLFGAAWKRAAPGHQLVPVAGGEEALRRLRADEAAPDLVCVDLKMPGISGLDVAREARARHPSQPVLVLTSSLSIDDARRAREAGADACVTKPTDLAETFELVRAITRWMAPDAPRDDAALQPFLLR
jgi:two-component system response regulator GlrR